MSPAMDQRQLHDSTAMMSLSNPKMYRLTNGPPKSPPSIWFEIRLFYVRIAPCAIDVVPEHLTLRHLRDELGVSLEINGSRVPVSETASSTLRRDRVDKETSEVTYVSTDSVRINGGVQFEVYEKENLLLCGSLEKLESDWSMDCYTAAGALTGGGDGSSAFYQPKLGITSPSIEVYVAGRWSDLPVILTKMITVSPRRKPNRRSALDAIPEVDDESEKVMKVGNDLIGHRKLEFTGTEDEYDTEGKVAHRWYPEDMYYEGEDGQLTWFNAGVRVGVGIGLGMCLGLGIGVGLLMRSYQTTTRNFRRRFF